jgi:2-iminobutanoate/2-iminopropanoate deaminase
MGLASLFAGSAYAAPTARTTAAPSEDQSGVRKLGYDGKPTDGTGFITPLIVHKGTIYIAGQGAHSRNPKEEFANDAETHTTKVLENVKTLVEAGGGTMDSILQLTVFLTKIDDFESMNKVFKTYFPHGGPARTTVAIAALPGQSLVEINCTAAVIRK